MLAERTQYIEACTENDEAGDAPGFRDWIRRRCIEDPRLFPYDMLRDEAATKAWQAQPRKKGPDLFSVASVKLPEHLTRYKKGFYDEGDEDGTLFEKISSKIATVNDRYEDALIKMRGAAKSVAAAEQDMQHADECRRRARGDMTVRLRDLAD
jgi:hypothetical protein